MIANDVTQLIGNTPLVKLNFPSNKTGATILGKCEFLNPTSSVKDRIALNMIQGAINKGVLTQNTHIIEPTSGNTGIGLASVCAAKSIKLTLTMPESMSIERRNLLKSLGANLELTPAKEGMKGAIQKAHDIAQEDENALILHQFENSDNPDVHRNTTALEILRDTNERIDLFVAAVGTGGTLTGTGEVLKQKLSKVHIVAVEPQDSAVLSGKDAASHKIQGIGAGFVPKILNIAIYDEIITVSNEDAIATAQMLAKNEGLLVGISSGANVYAAMQVAKRSEFQGKTVVTILCDTAERYMSTDLFKEI